MKPVLINTLETIAIMLFNTACRLRGDEWRIKAFCYRPMRKPKRITMEETINAET